MLRGEARLFLSTQTEQPTQHSSLAFSPADGGLIGTVFASDILQCPRLTCSGPVTLAGPQRMQENRGEEKL